MKFFPFLLLIVLLACQTKKEEVVVLPEETVEQDLSSVGKSKLSEYGFFKGALHDLSPTEGVVPYALNSALFSDYAFKQRFIKIPAGLKAAYNPDEVFEFPEGTVLIKNFYYPADFQKPTENIRILETRLLMLENGIWKTLPYIWNDEQTEAYLNVAGKNIDVSWKHTDGAVRNIKYSVPNMNQCKNCHLKGEKVMPIGPSARQLNGDYHYEGGNQNQLAHWKELHMIDNVPAHEEIPVLARYDDKNELVAKRARAWLEINCAHCHRADGPAKNSGLHLSANVTDLARLGVGKAPVAAGKGSGGLTYGIVPGKPDESILQFRIESIHPGIMMPELGRSVVDEEGVKLIRQWIAEMK